MSTSENLPDYSRYGYVYRITNLLNGKTYIGQRKCDRDIHVGGWEGYYGSGKLIQESIQKYGKEYFRKELVGYYDTPEELSQFEHDFIIAEWESGKGEYNISAFQPNPTLASRTLSVEQKLEANRIRRETILRNEAEAGITRSEKVIAYNKAKYEKIFTEVGSEVLEAYKTSKNIQEVARKFGIARSRVRDFLVESGVELNDRNRKGISRPKEESEKIRRLALIREMGKCFFCREKMELPNSIGFCSSLCESEYAKSGKFLKMVDGILLPHRNCKNSDCGIIFPTYAKSHNKIYCSRECNPKTLSSLTLTNNTDFQEKVTKVFKQTGSVRAVARELGVNNKWVTKALVEVGVPIPKQGNEAARKALQESAKKRRSLIPPRLCAYSICQNYFRVPKKTDKKKCCSKECGAKRRGEVLRNRLSKDLRRQ